MGFSPVPKGKDTTPKRAVVTLQFPLRSFGNSLGHLGMRLWKLSPHFARLSTEIDPPYHPASSDLDTSLCALGGPGLRSRLKMPRLDYPASLQTSRGKRNRRLIETRYIVRCARRHSGGKAHFRCNNRVSSLRDLGPSDGLDNANG